MLLNKISLSQRCSGTVDENGYVTITKIHSYDIVGQPGFTGAYLGDDLDKMLKEQERQELLKARREKIERLRISE